MKNKQKKYKNIKKTIKHVLQKNQIKNNRFPYVDFTGPVCSRNPALCTFGKDVEDALSTGRIRLSHQVFQAASVESTIFLFEYQQVQ